MPTLVRFFVIGAIAIHLSAIRVAADPIVVVGGRADFDTGDPPAYLFFTADGRFEGDMGLKSWTAVCFFECPSGVVVPLSSVFSAPGGFDRHVVLKDGVRASALGELVFSAAPVILSRETGTPRGPFSLEFWQPFTMEGRIAGFASPELAGEPLFDTMFAGRGMARLIVVDENVARSGGAETFSFSSLDYFFAPATPVPEPGTLLLLSAGAALLYRRRRVTPAGNP